MIPPYEAAIRLALAATLGGIVGLERERLDRAAGLRTHALVAVGAALAMLVSSFGFEDILGSEHVTLDPSRVAAQVVSGVGFLGAGTIILQREVVRGLTTAASVWAVAAIGLAVGGGLYFEAGFTTFIALAILLGLKPVENRLFGSHRQRVLTLSVDRQQVTLHAIEDAVRAAGLRMERIIIRTGAQAGQDRIELMLPRAPDARVRAAVDNLRHITGVREISLLGTIVNSGDDSE
jgi:putative Mg2+ transporter-C (MgtC) family protein